MPGEQTKLKNISNFYITCPHCDDIVYITKVKCAVFLHAYNTETNEQLNPHMEWFNVDKIRRSGKLGGCGGRFKIVMDDTHTITSTPVYY